MSQPSGLHWAVRLSDGMPSLRVNPIDRTADAIWNAVEAAIDKGLTPAEFATEAKQAWTHITQKHADWAKEDAAKVFTKGK